jgi:uncharacterized protein involved in outer membrane biogenesis
LLSAVAKENALKSFLYGLLGLIGLMVAAALVGPSLVDWNAHKDLIASEVRKATGRDLAIEGDVHLAVLPAPALSVDKVRLANLDGGSEPTMAELNELRVRIALWPLLRGRMQVESVSLVEPRILLEVLADGRRNWEFDKAGPENGEPTGPAESDSEEGLAGQVQLDNFEIVSGTLIYRDATSGQQEQIEGLDVRIVAESLAGPFAAKGDAVLRGVETGFELAIGHLLRDGATPLNLALELPGPGVRTTFAGSLSIHPETLRLRGQVKGEGGDLSAAVRTLLAGTAGPLPGYLGQPFSVQAEFSGDLDQVKGANLRVQLGEARLEGEASLRFGPPPDLAVSLSTTRFDLDQLLSLAGTNSVASDEQGAAAPAEPGTGKSPARGFLLPDDVKARLELAVEGLVYRGQAIRQFRFDAALADGRINLGKARALLPGGSNLSLNGVLAGEDVGPRFRGRLEATSDNLRGLAAWLDMAPGAVPADRLRRMSFTGKIEATPEQVSLEEIDLRIDLSRITGGVVVALRQRLALGIGLAVDTLNLDAYLPAATAWPGEPAAGAGQDDGAAGAEGGKPGGDPALVDRFDANLNLKVGSLAWHGQTAKTLRLNGTLKDGSLTLREAAFDELAGTRGSFAGSLKNLAAAPAVDGTVALDVLKPQRLARALGIDPAVFARLGNFTARSSLTGTRDDMSFDGELAALGGKLGLVGKARPSAQPLTFDVVVTAWHPNLAGLAAALGGVKALKANLGDLDLKGRLSGTPFKIKASELSGRVGGTDLTGQLDADMSGPKPVLDATLALGELPLAALAAPAAGGKRPAAGGGARAARPRWSKEPIDLTWFNALDAEVGLTARVLQHDKLRLEDVALQAALNDGVLDLKRLTGTLYGGAVQVIGKIKAKERLDAGLAVTAFEVESGPLLREQADFKRVSGPIDLNAELTTAGASEAELIATLSGKGDIKGSLTYKAGKEEQLGSLALDILGAKVKQVGGLAAASTVLFSAFAGAPAALAGTFTVQNGVVVTQDTVVDGRDARALTQAKADLPRWHLDSRTDVFRAAEPKTPYLTARLKGPLDEPDVQVAGQPFQRRAPAPAGTEDSQAQPEAAPESPPPSQQIKPEDIIKNLLKGLGN